MENNNKRLLVIAKKYNDIFYALSIPEWKESSHKILLIITDKLSGENYPMRHCFDEVHCIHQQKGGIGQFLTNLEIKRLIHSLSYNTVILSNISLVSNKLILCSSKCKDAILLEDGYMNYYEFKEPNYLNKRIVMGLLGINQETVMSKITKTYLLKPSESKYSFGKLERLELDTKSFSDQIGKLPKLQGKKLFVGQPLYHSYTGNTISIEEYNEYVNEAIKKFGIDYYVPHTMADDREDVHCDIFNLGDYSITFEILASLYDLEFYSVSSTVLYSTKIINPNVKSFMLVFQKVKKPTPDNILYKYVDKVIEM